MRLKSDSAWSKPAAAIDARDSYQRARRFMSRSTKAKAMRRGRFAPKLGADPNTMEAQKYDIVTIAAVANDVPMLKLALEHGGRATNITSPYEGTALIAAAHLGHDQVVRMLIAAQAPLDHVNNLGWTALIESIVLGDGGKRHIACLDALVKAGANVNLADRNGSTPLTLAKGRGFTDMVKILSDAGVH